MCCWFKLLHWKVLVFISFYFKAFAWEGNSMLKKKKQNFTYTYVNLHPDGNKAWWMGYVGQLQKMEYSLYPSAILMKKVIPLGDVNTWNRDLCWRERKIGKPRLEIEDIKHVLVLISEVSLLLMTRYNWGFFL